MTDEITGNKQHENDSSMHNLDVNMRAYSGKKPL